MCFMFLVRVSYFDVIWSRVTISQSKTGGIVRELFWKHCWLAYSQFSNGHCWLVSWLTCSTYLPWKNTWDLSSSHVVHKAMLTILYLLVTHFWVNKENQIARNLCKASNICLEWCSSAVFIVILSYNCIIVSGLLIACPPFTVVVSCKQKYQYTVNRPH